VLFPRVAAAWRPSVTLSVPPVVGAVVEGRVEKLADETGLVLHVHHYPPGTSKWNKIEHRLFCHITQTWRGRPLVDRMAVVELIAATTTKAGLKVESALDTAT